MDQAMMVSGTQAKTFYRIAGALAIAVVLAGLADAATSAGIEARDNNSVNILEWIKLFQTNPFPAFSSLGLINIITLSLSIPIYLAITQAFQQHRPALAGLAASLYCIGAAVYFSSNTVFPLFAISQQYATASAAQKPVLEAAGTALLAQGADLTSGTFAGLCMTQIAGLLMTSAMLRGQVFGKWTGLVGLAGFSLMTVFFLLTAFVPAHYQTAMWIAAPGALLMIAYELLLARRFFQLGR